MPGSKNKRTGSAAASGGQPSEAGLLEMLAKMHLLRAFDQKVGERCKRGEIPGLIHLGIGEEAVAVGVCRAIRPEDKITSTHRAHGHFLAKGGSPKALMAELYGKQAGCCRGKGGAMHLVDLKIGFLGANGVVGAGLPLAVGAALGARIKGENWVVACFFGDGANNEGSFHESLNLAAIWNLPVVFLCENNQYGISQSISTQQKVANVADRAAAYGMPSQITDGNDVLAVFETVAKAADRARQGKGPTLVECKTYRVSEHYEGDQGAYRDPDEVAAWLQNDPIQRLEALLLERAVLSPVELERLPRDAEAMVNDAVAFAASAPYPAPDKAERHVFAAGKRAAS
ncbi:MAG TPA: thiamine pyrophosphate-dependent dehydrogenase E1 component subunit alpha [Rhodospirillales bacterium]|jgi:pyruvate dehydrogenase E1 component alpha subunit|nr:thiamine pyrophosphate-dependent dehydrogenase E1 component subunit alpha [Rhodospirillales bacterium]